MKRCLESDWSAAICLGIGRLRRKSAWSPPTPLSRSTREQTTVRHGHSHGHGPDLLDMDMDMVGRGARLARLGQTLFLPIKFCSDCLVKACPQEWHPRSWSWTSRQQQAPIVAVGEAEYVRIWTSAAMAASRHVALAQSRQTPLVARSGKY